MIRTSRYVALILSALLLIACDTENCDPVPMSASSPEYLAFVEEVLAPEPMCAPPCWKGITPGVSTREDALAALGALPFVDASGITQAAYEERYPGVIDWAYVEPETEYNVRSQATLDRDDIVISMHFGATGMHPIRSLGQMLDIFGEPDFYAVIPGHDYSCKRDTIVWVTQGVTISAFAERAGEAGPRLTDETALFGIAYFEPQQTLDAYLRSDGMLSEDEIQDHLSYYKPWPGLDRTGIEETGTPAP